MSERGNRFESQEVSPAYKALSRLAKLGELALFLGGLTTYGFGESVGLASTSAGAFLYLANRWIDSRAGRSAFEPLHHQPKTVGDLDRLSRSRGGRGRIVDGDTRDKGFVPRIFRRRR